MGLDRNIDITAKQRKTVLALLAKHLPNTTAWVYGSRAKWTSRPQSDLDVVVFATPEQSVRVGELREAFEDSDLPFRVDLFVWATVPEQFRKQIEADHVVLVGKENLRASDTWQKVSVEEISDKVAMGPFGSSIKVNTFVPEGVPIISGQHLHRIRVDDAPGFNFITPEHADRLASSNVRRGDVVFTHAGNIGQVAYIPEGSRFDRYVISQRQFYMRCNPTKAISEFLALYFTSPEGQHQLLANASQVGVPSIAQPVTYLRTIEVPLPPLPEQRAIAHILGTLDDKIELNRRMNETLEAMARALFKSWFVYFDPVRTKMEGRDPGLPQHLADLFPDRLVPSELGEIPEGWEVSKIGEEVDAMGGTTPSTKEPAYWNGGQQHWATPKDLSKLLSPVLLETDRKITDAGVKKISSGLLPVGTVLLSSRAPIGYLAIAEVPTAVNQGFIAMVCEKRLPYLYVLFWCYENLDHIKDIAGGSTFAEISKKAFRPVPVVVPSEEVLAVYEDKVRTLYDRIVANTKESVLLVSLRDTLLPKLISGEIHVRNADKQARAIV